MVKTALRPRVASIGVGAQSTLGGDILPKNISKKLINKMPKFCIITGKILLSDF